MADDKDKKLLSDIKNYLDITWDDTLGDQKYMGMVQRGIAAIRGIIWYCNFYEETQEIALLFDYVMYATAGEIPQFWANYKEEILSLQIARKVDAYAADTEQTI